MSFWAIAIVAANSAVMPPTHAIDVGTQSAATAMTGLMRVEQEHAAGDHRGRVDQRRDRGRALHGVGEPEVERELCTLAGAPSSRSIAIADAVVALSVPASRNR